jgi:hypothetical protein
VGARKGIFLPFHVGVQRLTAGSVNRQARWAWDAVQTLRAEARSASEAGEVSEIMLSLPAYAADVTSSPWWHTFPSRGAQKKQNLSGREKQRLL